MKNRLPGYRTIGRSAATMLAMLTLVLALSSMNAAAAPTAPGKGQPSTPALTQYFQDIDTGNFFYQVTADLYNTGVVSGYTCGTPPAGPCVPPANLPYYVPNNNVTRGLMAIYIDNARTRAGMAIDGRVNNPNSHTPFSTYMTGTNAISLFAEQFGSGSQDNYGNGAQGIVGWGAGDYTQGVFGYGNGTNHSIGVYGYSTNYYGGYFTSTNGTGLYAAGTTGFGGYFNSVNNYGLFVNSSSSDAGDFYGADWGVYVRNSGATHPAVDAASSGANSYGGSFESDNWNALYVAPPPAANGRAQAYVVGTDASLFAVDIDPGALYVNGNLDVTGSKTGYVVDAMQNADSVALEPGDVVVIAGNSTAPVGGQIPVPSIRLATSADDSSVVGVVDAPLYVPSPAVAAAYKAQQEADREASINAAKHPDQKLSQIADIPANQRISQQDGLPHQDDTVKNIAPGSYCNVVTLGAYKAVKVDASFGPIHPGDLLTTSPHAGYAMVVKDKAAAYGAVIGKALSGLDSGTGTVTVMVSLK